MNLAVAALEDPPVGAGMAEVAMPLDEGAVGLDHLEDVGAAGCEGHGCCLLVRCGNGDSGGALGVLREAVLDVRWGSKRWGADGRKCRKSAKRRSRKVWYRLVTTRRYFAQEDAPT